MKSFFETIPLAISNVFFVLLVNIFEPVVNSSVYFSFWIVLTVAQQGVIGMGQSITLLGGKNFNLIVIALAGVYVFTMLISGSFVSLSEMPYIYQALSTFSVPRFTFASSMLLLFGFGRCQEKEVNIFLYSMDFHDADYLPSIGMLAFNAVFYRSLSLYLLVCRLSLLENRKKRVARIVQHQAEMIKQT